MGRTRCARARFAAGTGDIQLTIVQTVALAGAIVVTTPQEIADSAQGGLDVRKSKRAPDRFDRKHELLISPSDQKRYDIFGSGGGEREAKRLRVRARPNPDRYRNPRSRGSRMPIAAEDPESAVGAEFNRIARELY